MFAFLLQYVGYFKFGLADFTVTLVIVTLENIVTYSIWLQYHYIVGAQNAN
jgi:hypothetical protein